MLIHVDAFDWNGPRRIPHLFSREAGEASIGSLRDWITALDEENAALRAGSSPLAHG
ncbi:hypothetical protein [Streptomyces sp. NPDC002994]|uniref:hypothetical protein n=1 Tax=Streptomyces sp. NPDC002994 TaxID=3154441 RepID=UPI0033A30104